MLMPKCFINALSPKNKMVETLIQSTSQQMIRILIGFTVTDRLIVC